MRISLYLSLFITILLLLNISTISTVLFHIENASFLFNCSYIIVGSPVQSSTTACVELSLGTEIILMIYGFAPSYMETFIFFS